MNASKLTSINPQSPSAAPLAGAAAEESAESAANPLTTFKGLLAQLKSLKLAGADSASAKPTDEPIADAGIADEMIAALISEPQPGASAPLLALLPASGITASAIHAEAPNVDESAGDALSLTQGADAKLSAAKITGKEPQTANFAASGESPPQVADVNRPGPAGPLNDNQAPDFAATNEPLAQIADASRSYTAVSLKELPAPTLVTAAMQPAHAAAPAAISAPPAAGVAQISTPFGTAAWGNELGQHIVWMTGNKQHVAALHLNPPHLGPLDITLIVNDKQTTAVFASPHGAVRDAIMAEMPRLREVLAESGITLGNASVTADHPRHGSAFASPQPQRESLATADSNPAITTFESSSAATRLGMVDLFA